VKKIALFVEGQTEQIFIKKLIKEIAGTRNVVFTEEKYHAKKYLELKSDDQNGEKYFALIVDCGSDDSVLTSMLDRHDRMGTLGYNGIIGLRDLYPKPRHRLGAIQRKVDAILPTKAPVTSLVIAVMEVETWFIKESSHFAVLSPNITKKAILDKMGFDCDLGDVHNISEPAKFLHSTYRIAGMDYKKKKAQVEATVDALDYEDLYLEHRNSLPSLDKLITGIESILF
jgi:hypothetical protein